MPIKLGDLWTNTLDLLGQAWWVEVSTTHPKFTYYFGPFATEPEAKSARAGYLEDLEGEAAQGIQSTIKRCKPDRLTIDHDMGEQTDREQATLLSGPVSI